MLISLDSHRSLSHTRGSFVPVNEGSVINFNSYNIVINAPPAPLPGVHNPVERLNVSVMCSLSTAMLVIQWTRQQIVIWFRVSCRT